MTHRPDIQPSHEPDRLKVESIHVYEPTKSWIPIKKLALFNNQKNPTLLGHVLLSMGLVSCFLVGDLLVSQFAIQKQKQWLAVPDPRVKVAVSNGNLYYYNPNDLIKKMLEGHQVTEKNKAAQQKETLKIYYLNITSRRFVHSDVLSHCYARTFVTITLVTFSAFLASLCLFFISRVGWERVNNTLINIFMICAGVVVMYGGLALSLNYEKNVKENEKLYVAYTNLENETLNFLATGRSREGQPVSTSDYIVYLNKRLEELSTISLNFNTSEILKYRDTVMKTINSNAQSEPNLQK